MSGTSPGATDLAAAVEQAKLHALKELAYGASHEINNPLANISARAQALLRDERDPERRRALEAIQSQALRAHEMISDMMLFARPPRLDRQPCDMSSLLESVKACLEDHCRRSSVELDLVMPESLPPVFVDAVQMAAAIQALCQNALEAIGRDGRIQLSASLSHDGRWVSVTVSDNGPGIPPDVRPHIFDPFYSGREAGRGLGVGLAKCWRVVSEHGGRVSVGAPQGDRGTAFTIEAPVGGLASSDETGP